MVMHLKDPTIVSNKIRASARGQECTIRLFESCNPETVVSAHLNTKWKGMGNKSPDLFIVHACNLCHHNLDSGHVPDAVQLRALMETQMRLYAMGLIVIPGAK